MYKPTPEEVSRILSAMPQGGLQANSAPEMPTMGQPLSKGAVVQPQMMPPPSQDSGGIADALRAYGNSGGQDEQSVAPPSNSPWPMHQMQGPEQAPADSPYAALLRELPGLAKSGMGAYDAWNTPAPTANQPVPSTLMSQFKSSMPQS